MGGGGFAETDWCRLVLEMRMCGHYMWAFGLVEDDRCVLSILFIFSCLLVSFCYTNIKVGSMF